MRNNQARWADLFLLLSVFLGAVVRFAPTMIAHSPINDGGMFYAMIGDLKANGFLLPAFTSYNHLNIPFAYPPLSLYAGAILSGLGIPTIEIMRWLPPLVSTLSIFAFFWMASSHAWLKADGRLVCDGLCTDAPLILLVCDGGRAQPDVWHPFLLLACGSAWALFSQRGRKYIWLTAVFGAAAILSYPETGLHTAAACLLIWFFKGRNRTGLRDALVVGIGVILLTSPWWGTVLAQHGWAPFRSALNTGGHGGLFWIPWLTFDFAEERFVTLFTVLGLIGLALACIRRQWFLPAWLLLPFLIEPRSATAIAALPLAILAGLGLADFVIPRLASLEVTTCARCLGLDRLYVPEQGRAHRGRLRSVPRVLWRVCLCFKSLPITSFPPRAGQPCNGFRKIRLPPRASLFSPAAPIRSQMLLASGSRSSRAVPAKARYKGRSGPSPADSSRSSIPYRRSKAA